MSVSVCGDCEHYATTEKNKQEGACMAFVKAIDGKWAYRPMRERNCAACGFFKERGKE